MISFQQFRNFFVTIILTIMLVITIGFDFGHTDSWTASLFTKSINPPQNQIATMNQPETIIKNIEGQPQEARGQATDNRKDILN